MTMLQGVGERKLKWIFEYEILAFNEFISSCKFI